MRMAAVAMCFFGTMAAASDQKTALIEQMNRNGCKMTTEHGPKRRSPNIPKAVRHRRLFRCCGVRKSKRGG